MDKFWNLRIEEAFTPARCLNQQILTIYIIMWSCTVLGTIGLSGLHSDKITTLKSNTFKKLTQENFFSTCQSHSYHCPPHRPEEANVSITVQYDNFTCLVCKVTMKKLSILSLLLITCFLFSVVICISSKIISFHYRSHGLRGAMNVTLR